MPAGAQVSSRILFSSGPAERQRPGQGVPLGPGARTLPRILGPAEVDALTAARARLSAKR